LEVMQKKGKKKLGEKAQKGQQFELGVWLPIKGPVHKLGQSKANVLNE